MAELRTHYVALDDAIENGKGPRIAYLDGELEIVTTSFRHEVTKKLLARLVEAFAEETGIALNGYGHMTQRNESERVAAEPDERYSIGKRTQRADLDDQTETIRTYRASLRS